MSYDRILILLRYVRQHKNKNVANCVCQNNEEKKDHGEKNNSSFFIFVCPYAPPPLSLSLSRNTTVFQESPPLLENIVINVCVARKRPRDSSIRPCASLADLSRTLPKIIFVFRCRHWVYAIMAAMYLQTRPFVVENMSVCNMFTYTHTRTHARTNTHTYTTCTYVYISYLESAKKPLLILFSIFRYDSFNHL